MINKIINMDCMSFMRSMQSGSVDLILTDIPYGTVTKNGMDRAKYGGQMRSFDKGNADKITFNLEEFVRECYRLARGSIYIFCGIEQTSMIFSYFDSKVDLTTRQCIWHKNNPSPVNGQHYWVQSTENCIFAKKRKTTFNEHCKHNVWNYPVERGKLHPTQKPVELFKHLIQSSSDVGDTVFDPCIGSGTTAVAAILSNRNFIGCDISADYCNMATKRVNGLQQQFNI